MDRESRMNNLQERLNRHSPLLLKGFLFGLWVGLPGGTLESQIVSLIVVGYVTFEFVILVRTSLNRGLI